MSKRKLIWAKLFTDYIKNIIRKWTHWKMMNFFSIFLIRLLPGKMIFNFCNRLCIKNLIVNGSWETLNDTKDKFIIPIRLEVKTEIESTNKNYSSYRIVLEGIIKDNNNETVNTPRNDQDYITYIITRINTDGIWD